MKIRVSSHLFAYTEGRDHIEAEGATAAELLHDLDRRHPGLRFRVVDEQGKLRQHIHLFLDTRSVRDLSTSLAGVQQVHLLGALSGG